MPSGKVFISYSHKDEVWKDRLVKHLTVLAKQGLLDIWDDRRIGAGGNWREEIGAALEGADAAILLISADFLTSDFILNEEVSRLLERRAGSGVHVVPVLVFDCSWQDVPWLAAMQVRPRDGRTLASFKGDQRNRELVKIAKEVRQLLRVGPRPQEPSPVEPRQPAQSQQSAQLVPTPALHQLPAPPADFTGREAELTELRAAVRGSGATISGVRGTGGIGKTALALKLAQELTPFYSDAQLYLDLKGVSPQPLTAAQAMTHVIRAYRPEAQVPEGEAELTGLYRSVLHDQCALLLMDNAAGPAQVEPLIPRAGCLLLVTSRFHFTLPGLVPLNLDELPEPDAQALLEKIAPRIGAAAGEIARLCGCLPIALRLAGGALAERPWLSPAEYARRLGDAKERLGLIEGALRTSYDLLAEELQALWRALAVFPGTFDAAAAAAVWERKLRAAEEALGELARSSLIEWGGEGEGEPGRFRLHDLARVFADARLSAAERDGAQQRHAAYYVDVLRAATRLYKEGGGALLQGLRLFDREWGNVQAGQAWAAARAGEDDDAAGLCSDYPDAGAYLLSLRQHPREWANWLEAALAAARRRNDRAAEGRHLGNLGTTYAKLGETRRAIEHYEQRIAIAREVDDRRGEANALGNLGIAYRDLAETRRAIEYHEQALTIHREIGDRRGEGAALGNLGNAYADLGETRRAVEHYEQRLAIAREIGDRHGEGQALGNLGVAYAALGETRRAIEHYERDLAIAREIRDRRGEGYALCGLGLAYAALGETRRAIEHYERDLAIAREIGDSRGEAIASWNLGLALEQEDELARAADLMQILVDYEHSLAHPDAEKHAAYLATLRVRISDSEPSPEGGHA